MDISIEIRRKKISRFIFQGHPLGNFCQNLYQWTHEFLTTKFFISFLANILVIVYIYIYMKKIKVHFNNFSRTFSMLDPLPVQPIDKILLSLHKRRTSYTHWPQTTHSRVFTPPPDNARTCIYLVFGLAAYVGSIAGTTHWQNWKNTHYACPKQLQL